MKILDIPGRDKKNLEQTLSIYNEQVSNKRICPELIRSPTLEDIPESGGLLTTTSFDGLFKGIAYYSQFNPADEEEFAEGIRELLFDAPKTLENWDLTAFKEYSYEGSAIYILELESFKKGTGRIMIDYIKNREDVETVFLVPTLNARDYYPKLGFSPQPITINKFRTPIMTWFKKSASNYG